MIDSSFKTSGSMFQDRNLCFTILEFSKLMIVNMNYHVIEYFYQCFQNPKSMMTKQATDNAPSK